MCRWLSGKLINDNQRTSLSWRAHHFILGALGKIVSEIKEKQEK
nr:MAG TPA: hypothetical protein [Caudoviricetes sp.]